ncbi:unnamed protein product [Tilletia controversa]|nr:unnamed protein product [Tilletia controversa]
MVTTAEKSKPRKTRTREQTFKKKKGKEASQRAASLAAAGTTAATARSNKHQFSSASAKGKGKAAAAEKRKQDAPSFRYVSFNDRLAAAHIDVARSQRSSAISGLDPLPGLSGAGASGSSTSTGPDTSAATLALFSSEDAALANLDLSELASTAFGTALVTWRELNQSLPFYAFVRRILPLSNSLPQLLHHAETIADALSELLGASRKATAGTDAPASDPNLEKKSSEQAASYLAFAPALDLIPRLAYDLQAEFLPFYPRSLEALLRTTQVTKADTDGVDFLAADIVEAAFKATAGLLRIVAPFVLSDSAGKGKAKKEQLQETWITLRPYLGWVEPRSPATPESFEDWDRMDVDGEEEDDDDDDEKPEGDQDEESVDGDAEDAEEEAEDEDDQDEEQLDGEEDTTLPNQTTRRQQYRRRRVPPHTHRFASEAFAHLVRKAKGARLAHVARFMLVDVGTMRGWADEGRISREDGKRFEAAVAGVWAEVIKSVDDHLHSSATSFIDATLLAEADTSSHADGKAVSDWVHTFAEARMSTGVLLLTALNHHSSATQMVGVVKHLLGWVEQRLQTPGALNALREAVVWLTTVVGVRKGNRIHESLKGPLFALLIQLANRVAQMTSPWDGTTDEGVLSRAILSLVILSFPTGRIQDLIGPGLKVMDALTPSSATSSSTMGDADRYAQQSFVFNALVLALADPTLAWSGFRQFVMPAVLKHTADVAAAFNRSSSSAAPGAPRSTHALDVSFALLARLNELGELGPAVSPAAPTPAIGKWRIQIGNALKLRMETLSTGDVSQVVDSSPTARAQLLAELSLLPMFAKDLGVELSSGLCKVIRVLVEHGCRDEESTLESYRLHPVNVVLVLSASLSALADLVKAANNEIGTDDAELKKSIGRPAFDLFFDESSTVVLDILQRCGFHIATVCALREALTVATCWWQRPLTTAADIAALPSISDALCSIEDRSRLTACELLALIFSLGTNKDEAAYYDRLLEIERTSMTIEFIRERNARVRAAARSVVQSLKLLPKGSTAPPHVRRAHSFTIRYIVGSLKLNFRPVWAESILALVDLAAVSGDEVWQVAFAQLDVVQDPVHAVLKSASWISTGGEQAEEDDGSDILERNFKDPVLDRRNKAFNGVFGAAASMAAGSSSLYPKDAAGDQRPRGRLDAVNYHDQILKFFGEVPRLAEKHNAPLVQRFFSIVSFDIDEEPKDESEDVEEKADVLRRSFLERRAQLCGYLELFGKFGNPKALLRTDDLHSYFLELCASGDLKVQQLALTCILTWKDQSQTPYADSLKNLLDPSTFRDELMQFDLAPESNIVQTHHRSSLMPLLVRLLYGQIISRRGKATAGPGKNSRKHAILSALASCQPADLDVLIQLMLRSLEDQLPVFEADSGQFKFSTQPSSASRKRQVGFLALLSDVLKHLGQLVLPHWPSLMGVTLNLGHHAVRTHESQSHETFSKGGRSVRRAVYQRLADFTRRSMDFDWMPFLIPMFDSMINAQAQLLRLEAMQGPTALLELLHTWSSRTDTMMFLGSVNEDIPRHLLACLAAPAAASSVISKVLEIFERIIAASIDENSPKEDRQSKRESLIEPYLGDILANGGALLARLQKPKNASAPFAGRDEILKRTVAMLAALAPHVQRPCDAELLLKLLVPMLRQQRTLDERVKKDLLSIFSDLCLKAPSFHDTESEFYQSLMEIMSSMFAVLRNRPTRTTLVTAFRNFGVVQPSLKQVTIWIEELNSYSTRRLEEPDFDRRLNAFFQINELDATAATAEVWLPLLHNMIFFVQDAEELAFRTNAAAALRQFFGLVATRMEDEEWQKLLLRVALPAIRKVMRSKADLVRREALSLLASAIEMLPTVPALSQMKGLLSDGDGEASFFNNIVHLQVHRRVRAMRRLGDEAEKGVMSGKLIKDTFIPLISIFLDPVQTSDQQIINEAINCVGRLAGALTWYGYQALVWSLIKSAREHPLNEKVVVRTLMTVLDNFRFDLKAVAAEEGPDPSSAPTAAAGDDVSDIDEGEDDSEAQARLAQNAKISEAVTTRLLPALMGFLEARDETDDAIRLPIAVGVARLALKLPTNESRARVNKLLHTLTGALKSKAQDTRDLTREVFLKIARILGPDWLFSMSIELKKGLTRGPQIAVSAFTFHAILVHLMDSPQTPLLTVDAEMPTIMSIVSEDLFGLTSEDRENTEYKSKHREVRSSKSLDSLERLAKISAPHRIATILLPFREVMERTEAQRPLRMVDDGLRRITGGLIANSHIDSHTFLVLCHSLISGNARFLQTKTKVPPGSSNSKTSVTGIDNGSVLQKRKAVESQRSDANHYGRNAFRFVAFGLDLLLTALKRGRLSFAGVDEQQQQLLPLVKSVGNALYSSHATIVQLALKATAELVKTPLEKVTESLPTFIKQIFAIIQAAGSAQSDTVQTAFRTLTTIIRERKDAVFQEKQLADLLRLMMPDLEEPNVQWVIFGLLRAIIARRFVIAEVYDVMTKIAEMMVTNQSAAARENCRALMLQFLLEYPQGKGRLKSQMSFFAKNLSFTYESGRLSVLELLRAIFSKFDDSALQPYHELIFVALVMVMANDDSESCRNSAGQLIRTIVGQQSTEPRSKTITMVHSWALQPNRPALSCVALQLYCILLEGNTDAGGEWLDKAMEIAMGIVRDCADDLVALQSESSMQGVALDSKLPLSALQAASRLFKAKPTLLDLGDEPTWAAVENLLVFPEESVRLTSSRLLGAMYAQSDVAAADSEETASASLVRSPTRLIETGKKLAQQLTLSPLSDDLSLQAVKNLLFIGRHLPTASSASTKATTSANAGREDIADDMDDEEDDGEENDDEEDADQSDEDEVMTNPLAWLFSKLSFQARNAVFDSEQRYEDRRWHAQPTAILRWFAAMASSLDVEVVKAFLPHMLTPIFYITDDTTLRGNEIEELKGLATEVQTMIQEKVGANTFSQAYSRIRQRALTKRRERKTAKLMTTISRPAAAAQRKSKVNARKHDSRKRKAQYQADSKIRNKPLKRHRTAE